MVKVMVVDDHEIVREGLKAILGRTPDLSVQAEASSGREAIEKVRSESCDVVVLDIGLPDKNGLDVLNAIRTEKPALPVLMLSMYPESRFAMRCLSRGASGYITKDKLSENLVTAIKRVLTGRKYLSPDFLESTTGMAGQDPERTPRELLSNREFQVLELMGEGLRMSEIAVRCDISVKTVSTYRTRILEKLSLQNSAQLVRYAVQYSLDVQR